MASFRSHLPPFPPLSLCSSIFTTRAWLVPLASGHAVSSARVPFLSSLTRALRQVPPPNSTTPSLILFSFFFFHFIPFKQNKLLPDFVLLQHFVHNSYFRYSARYIVLWIFALTACFLQTPWGQELIPLFFLYLCVSSTQILSIQQVRITHYNKSSFLSSSSQGYFLPYK